MNEEASEMTEEPKKPQAQDQPKPKRNIPNLWRFVDPEPPAGYKRDYRFVERRDSRQNIALTNTLKERIEVLAARYKLSQNSLINAILNRFMEEVIKIDQGNGVVTFPPRTQKKQRSDRDEN